MRNALTTSLLLALLVLGGCVADEPAPAPTAPPDTATAGRVAMENTTPRFPPPVDTLTVRVNFTGGVCSIDPDDNITLRSNSGSSGNHKLTFKKGTFTDGNRFWVYVAPFVSAGNVIRGVTSNANHGEFSNSQGEVKLTIRSKISSPPNPADSTFHMLHIACCTSGNGNGGAGSCMNPVYPETQQGIVRLVEPAPGGPIMKVED